MMIYFLLEKGDYKTASTITTTSTSTAAALTTETTITTTRATNAVVFDTHLAEPPYLEPWQLSA